MVKALGGKSKKKVVKKMIIIRLSGGLGNQMFQYALYWKMMCLDKDVKLDISYYQAANRIREFEIEAFKVGYKAASSKEIIRMGVNDYTIWGKLTGKLHLFTPKIYEEDLDAGYQANVFDFNNIYLNGYWQSEKYFRDIREELINIYQFPAILNTDCASLLKDIEHELSVSVHVRRNDYLNGDNLKVYGGICTSDYYNKAISYFRKKYENPQFFIFSDDTGWVRENFTDGDMRVVDINNEKSFYDMLLMSRCKHNIIANSSFSWWGAWLNQNQGKEVIAPRKWLNNHDLFDIYCEGWITL